QQERSRRRAIAPRADAEETAARHGADGEDLVVGGPTADEEAERERERTERAAQRARREAAIRFNVELGLLAFKHLAKVKADERVLRILASIDLGGALRQIAMRGARLCLPGW